MARGFRRKGSRENTRYVAQLDPLELGEAGRACDDGKYAGTWNASRG